MPIGVDDVISWVDSSEMTKVLQFGLCINCQGLLLDHLKKRPAHISSLYMTNKGKCHNWGVCIHNNYSFTRYS